MTLPPIPKDRDWSEATWRAGLDEAVRLAGVAGEKTWADFELNYFPSSGFGKSIIAHATTLLDAGIVKPVVSEAGMLLEQACKEYANNNSFPDALWEFPASIAVIQAALDKARAGQ